MRNLTFLLLLLLAACSGNDNNNKKKTTETTRAAAPADGETCYRRVQGRDTFSLRLQRNGADLSGDLGFDNYEKDSSRGTVTGKVTGNVYRLIYVFESEGSSSVMEIFFRREGNGLVRGVGPMENSGDTVRYAHPGSVQFLSEERWEPVDCAKAAR
ncbi:hypothetical protein EPD60_07005 [Flaviaesturariibacter flavus]|uniref:Lipoprotein n=1 Tax=Flaviaesturariibacter flavus TaxID=2502780 RepID=A0A4R1BIF5_9BACT|nr:hypothetical protein [Flaviaesturariibacter flavus]TCJ17053.1 hypothetical protein EPD60_07005 [Flaviaesturariibacter flavus]